ncbi:hypothetical protein ACQP2P_13585 [Dactylosporangium sp. CA-139114]|uniref:hypothetical protein n=1 Tax=Dactylosporangium sp. CA-139114 TaxID=3239931 RepID=UPI003D971114
MIRLAGNPLIQRLRRLVVGLELDSRDFVIFGSAPLLAHGVRTRVSDLDVVARGAAWERVCAHGLPVVGTINGAPMMRFEDGLIEFSRGWVSDDWNGDELIDRAEMIEGLPFAPLADVLRYKRTLNRPKDRDDIVAIERYLAANGFSPSGSTSSPA